MISTQKGQMFVVLYLLGSQWLGQVFINTHRMESCLVFYFNALNWNIAKINTENKGLCMCSELSQLVKIEGNWETGDQSAQLISNLHIDETMSQTKANISQSSDMYNPTMLDKKFQ